MPTPKSYQCRHIFVDGHQCGSPALLKEIFCFYHHTTRRPPRHLRSRGGFAAYTFNMPEDRHSLQHALNEVLTLIAVADIGHQRAKLLLYGLSIVSNNLTSLARHADVTHTTDRVTDMVFDQQLGPLALEPTPEIEEIPSISTIPKAMPPEPAVLLTEPEPTAPNPRHPASRTPAPPSTRLRPTAPTSATSSPTSTTPSPATAAQAFSRPAPASSKPSPPTQKNRRFPE